MIVLTLLTLVGSLISSLPIEGPSIDPSVFTYLDQAWDYIMNAINILGVFIGPLGMKAIGMFLMFILSVNLFYFTWQVFSWIVTKIPFLNIRP